MVGHKGNTQPPEMVMKMDMVIGIVLLVIDIDIITDFVTDMVIVIVLVIVTLIINRKNIKYEKIKVKITNFARFLITDGGEQEKTEFPINQMKQRR